MEIIGTGPLGTRTAVSRLRRATCSWSKGLLVTFGYRARSGEWLTVLDS